MVFFSGLRWFSKLPSSSPRPSSILDIVARLGRTSPSQSEVGRTTRRTANKVIYPELDLGDENLDAVSSDIQRTAGAKETSLIACTNRAWSKTRINNYLKHCHKDITLMSSVLTAGGRIQPRNITGLGAKQQRLLSRSIKRARVMGLIPYTSSVTLAKGF